MLSFSLRITTVVAVALMAIAIIATPAGAANGTTQISTTGYIEAVSPDGITPAFTADCPGPSDMATYEDFIWFTIVFEDGNLRGCLYTLVETYAFSPNADASPVTYHETGREVFEGAWYDDDGGLIGEGTFETQYQFHAKFTDASLAVELHGRCQHPIVSGTGVFEGVSGRFDIKDDVETGALYVRGHLTAGS